MKRCNTPEFGLPTPPYDNPSPNWKVETPRKRTKGEISFSSPIDLNVEDSSSCIASNDNSKIQNIDIPTCLNTMAKLMKKYFDSLIKKPDRIHCFRETILCMLESTLRGFQFNIGNINVLQGQNSGSKFNFESFLNDLENSESSSDTSFKLIQPVNGQVESSNENKLAIQWKIKSEIMEKKWKSIEREYLKIQMTLRDTQVTLKETQRSLNTSIKNLDDWKFIESKLAKYETHFDQLAGENQILANYIDRLITKREQLISFINKKNKENNILKKRFEHAKKQLLNLEQAQCEMACQIEQLMESNKPFYHINDIEECEKELIKMNLDLKKETKNTNNSEMD